MKRERVVINRGMKHKAPTVEVCACDESNLYLDVLQDVSEWLHSRASHLAGGSELEITRKVREALRIRPL